MANEIKKIKIKVVESNDKFFNITGEDGIKYGVARDKSPKLCAILATAKVGDEITGEYFMWKENHYLSDPKEAGKGGAKTFTPRDKFLDCAIAAGQAAATFHSLDKEAKTNEKLIATTEALFIWMTGKISKPATDPK